MNKELKVGIMYKVAALALLLAAIFAAVFFYLILNGEKTQEPTENPMVISPYVTANGSQLLADGRTFKFIGVNRYNILTTTGSGCFSTWSPEELGQWFSELRSMGVNSVRFWAFQSFTASGLNLARFDLIIRLAKENDIKLIPVLENQWVDCSQGGYKYDSWYDQGYKSPYGSYPLSLPEYINRIVPRYKDETAILMWQVMNEAENKARNETCGSFEHFSRFAKEVTDQIRSLDPNHLISLGTVGDSQCGLVGDQYIALHSHPNVNVLEVHDYSRDKEPLPAFIEMRIATAKELGKPLFVGEAGIQASVPERPSLLKSKIESAMNLGAAGYLIWSYRNNASGGDGYDFDFDDPIATSVLPSMTASYLNP
jgi:endo-1,4-beta-mannosidase